MILSFFFLFHTVRSYVLSDHLKGQVFSAARNGSLEDLEYAIRSAKLEANDSPIDFNFRVLPDWYLLCEVETSEKLGLLLDAGADPNYGITDRYPLYYTIFHRKDKVLTRVLLERGAIPTKEIMLKLCSMFVNDEHGPIAEQLDMILGEFQHDFSADMLLSSLAENFRFATFGFCEHRLRVLLKHGANLLAGPKPAFHHLLVALDELETDETVIYLDIMLTHLDPFAVLEDGESLDDLIVRSVDNELNKLLTFKALEMSRKRASLKKSAIQKFWILQRYSSGKDVSDPFRHIASFLALLVSKEIEGLSIINSNRG